jgi:dsRNA-specific ribonuclease
MRRLVLLTLLVNEDEYSREFRSSKVKAKEAAAEVALKLLRDEYPGVYDEN